MDFFVLFKITRVSVEYILRIFRQKDLVEKAFVLKLSMEPLDSRTKRGAKARLFLSIVGYSTMGIIAAWVGFIYQQTEKIILGIKEIVYTNGSPYVIELTKEQKKHMLKNSFE